MAEKLFFLSHLLFFFYVYIHFHVFLYNSTVQSMCKNFKSSVEVFPIEVNPIEGYLFEAYLTGKGIVEVSGCHYLSKFKAIFEWIYVSIQGRRISLLIKRNATRSHFVYLIISTTLPISVSLNNKIIRDISVVGLR
jgi:hypothetical protein